MGKPRRLPLLIGIGVLVLALAAGGAFAAVKLLTPGGALGGPVQLKVTGEPLVTSGNWASGVREMWNVSSRHRNSGTGESDSGYWEVSAATNSSWAVVSPAGDSDRDDWGIDPKTGTVAWGGRPMFDGVCASDPVDGKVACVRLGSATSSGVGQSVALVDWATGNSVNETSFEALGLRGSATPAWNIDVIDGALILTMPHYQNEGVFPEGLTDVTVARISPDTKKTIWQATLSGCEEGEGWVEPAKRAHLVHGALLLRHGIGVDFETGKSIAPGSLCVGAAAENAVAVQVNEGEVVPTSLTAPDGTSLAVVRHSGVQLAGEALPPNPLRVSDMNYTDIGEADSQLGTAHLDSFDPATGRSLWTAPVTIGVTSWSTRLDAGEAILDAGRMYIGDQQRVAAVDTATGAVVWYRENIAFQNLELAKSGVLVGHGYGEMAAGTTGVDPATGRTYFELNGDARIVPSPSGAESLFALVWDPNSQHISRFDPADRPTKATVAPASAPACPDGMTPISFTKYSDGGILLCRTDQKYVVISTNHPDWQAAELNFSGGGHEVVFSNGVRVRVSLGGSVVYTDQNGKVSTETAAQAWSNAVGDVKVTVPKDLKTCPTGSWPISLSTYDGGWLLVCGTTAAAPTSMVYFDGTNATDLGSVSYRNGGYCGTGTVGTVCGYAAPAVVSVTDGTGKVTQHSAGGNYFDGRGSGGAGQGNGSYGVEAPTDNAKDQVRYLTQILQKSAAGRSNLDAAVAQVRNCSDVAGAITTMNGVVANRQELLDALDSTPVDAVPDGAGLVAKLRNALQLSHDSDLVWVKWAQAQQANSCATGENDPLYQQVTGMNQNVAAAKDAFVNSWNSQITPAYSAPTFQTSQI